MRGIKDIRAHLLSRRTIDADTGCWNYTGYRTRAGYGQYVFHRKSWKIHRLSYELFVGPIPEGLHIDHLCRNKWCFNPAHLEPVTQAVNNRRGKLGRPLVKRAFCKRGHPLSDDNLVKQSDGRRRCKQCARNRHRNWIAVNRAKSREFQKKYYERKRAAL